VKERPVSSSEGLSPAAAVPGPAVSAPPGPAVPAPPGAASTTAEGAPPAESSATADPVSELRPERIAERVAVLDAVGALPLREHVEVYQRLHAELQSALAEIDGP
jgi:hypothetical protein